MRKMTHCLSRHAASLWHFSHAFSRFLAAQNTLVSETAHKTNYFSALVVGCFWCVIAISNIRNPLIYCVNCYFLMFERVPSSKVLSCKHERLLDYLNLISKNVNIIKVENPGRKLCEMNINIIFVQAATVARYPAATRLVADCK